MCPVDVFVVSVACDPRRLQQILKYFTVSGSAHLLWVQVALPEKWNAAECHCQIVPVYMTSSERAALTSSQYLTACWGECKEIDFLNQSSVDLSCVSLWLRVFTLPWSPCSLSIHVCFISRVSFYNYHFSFTCVVHVHLNVMWPVFDCGTDVSTHPVLCIYGSTSGRRSRTNNYDRHLN